MSVIARKIALANKSDAARPEAADVAETLLPHLSRALCVWLSMEDVQIELTRAEWAMRKADDIPGILISTRGSLRSLRIGVAMTEPLAQMAAQDVLQIESALSDDALAALKPFVEQNMLTFGARLNETRVMAHCGRDDADWSVDTIETLQDDFGAFDTLSMEFAFLDGDGGDMRIVIMATEELLGLSQPEEDAPEPEPAPVRLPPRLGPCHVTVRAVADRVRMSVADCSRLTIGQVIGLPGLRFDHLELNVEMGEGPVPLTDAALGADKGVKAVRLNRGLDPAFRAAPPAIKDKTSKPASVPA